MEGIRLLLVITKREYEDDYLEFFKRHGMTAMFSALCEGTAGQTTLSLLGLEKTEKVLLCVMVERKKAEKLQRHMVSQLGINMPGNGIALTLPVGSLGGASAMKYLMEKQDYIFEEGAVMEERPIYPYDLIVAIAERGSSEKVMSAARTAGAGGGTIVHAKGTGTDFTERFFGMSIAAEKDVVLIVAKHADKAAIMRAVMEQAGIRTEAHTAMFSLPVEDVEGLTSVMNPANEDEA